MTQTYTLIGHPVGHSISPAIHAAAYEALGLGDHRYVAVDCPDEASVLREIERLRIGEIRGANVTVPWKRLALESADATDPLAKDTGAANVLMAIVDGGKRRIVAHNTDVGALADELRLGRTGSGSAVVIGSGGAALASVVACRSIGAKEVAVSARKWRGPEARWPQCSEFRALGASPIAWPVDDVTTARFNRAMSEAAIIVQATSAGMKGADSGTLLADIIPWETLRDDAFAYDVVYNPPSTPFLEAARARGLACRGGLGMLVGQAARAVTLWLGVPAPVDAMWKAAEQALAARRTDA